MTKILIVFFAAVLMSGCAQVLKGKPTASDADSAALQKAADMAVQASKDLAVRQDEIDQNVSIAATPPLPSELLPPPVDPLADKVVDITMSDAPLDQLLSALADQLSMNLLIDPQITAMNQRASISMRRVSARDVLTHIFQVFDIDGSVRKGLITANLLQSRIFDIEMLGGKSSMNVTDGGDVFGSAGKQAGSDALKGNTSIVAELGIKIDPYETLAKSIESILSDTGQRGKSDAEPKPRYAINRAGGTLFVSARPSKIRAIEELLEHDRVTRSRQVQIEAQLIDVQLSDAFQFGVDWNLLTKNLAGRLGTGATTIASVTSPLAAGGLASRAVTIPAETLGSPDSQGNGLSFSGHSFSAAINALRTFGTVKMLSNPVVRVSNGVPAYLSVGSNIRYVSKIDSTVNNIGGGSSAVSTDVQTDSLFSGVVVGVSVFVTPAGKIELFVHPLQTLVEPASLALVSVGNGNSVTLPIVDMKGITTSLSMNSGDTVIIGGLIDQQINLSDSGLPGLSDVPVFGKLFSTISNSHSNRELIVVLRARSL